MWETCRIVPYILEIQLTCATSQTAPLSDNNIHSISEKNPALKALESFQKKKDNLFLRNIRFGVTTLLTYIWWLRNVMLTGVIWVILLDCHKMKTLFPMIYLPPAGLFPGNSWKGLCHRHLHLTEIPISCLPACHRCELNEDCRSNFFSLWLLMNDRNKMFTNISPPELEKALDEGVNWSK